VESIVAALSAFFGKLFADEFKAWLPWVTERLTRGAVSILPQDQQERYSEEWRSHLREIPGELGRLFVALDLFRAAYTISDRRLVGQFLVRTSALLLLVINAPLFVVILLLVKSFVGEGPILLVERRSTDDCVIRTFVFRTFDFSRANCGPYALLHCHLRITPMTPGEWAQLKRIFHTAHSNRIGRFLEVNSLDRIPVLINILRGDIPIKHLKTLLFCLF